MWKHTAYSVGYLEKILEMAQEYYGPENDIANRDFLLHQYFENPSGDAIIDLAVDKDNNVLAGQYIVCPMAFQINGQRVRCVNSLNTLTRETYQGQGIFTELAREVYRKSSEEGYAFCYGMPNQNSYPGFIKKLDFTDLGPVPLMLRPLYPSNMIKEFTQHKLLSFFARPTDQIFKIRAKCPLSGIEIVPVTYKNLALMDQFWQVVKEKYPIMNIRSASYLRFRYLDMPRRMYYPYVALQNQMPVGFAVGRLMKVAGMQCAMMAEFLYGNGYENAANQLLNKVLFDMQERGANLAGCLMLKHTEEALLLKKNGFFQCPRKLEPQPFPLILRVFDNSMEIHGISNIKNWFFTMGDYDVI